MLSDEQSLQDGINRFREWIEANNRKMAQALKETEILNKDLERQIERLEHILADVKKRNETLKQYEE